MTGSPPLTSDQAKALVEDKHGLLASGGPRHRPELAKALLELSQAYEREDQGAEALGAAKDSVATLAPDFLENPRWFAVPMRALIAQYVALAQRSGEKPDEALLAPIAQALGDLTRIEDADDDD